MSRPRYFKGHPQPTSPQKLAQTSSLILSSRPKARKQFSSQTNYQSIMINPQNFHQLTTRKTRRTLEPAKKYEQGLNDPKKKESAKKQENWYLKVCKLNYQLERQKDHYNELDRKYKLQIERYKELSKTHFQTLERLKSRNGENNSNPKIKCKKPVLTIVSFPQVLKYHYDGTQMKEDQTNKEEVFMDEATKMLQKLKAFNQTLPEIKTFLNYRFKGFLHQKILRDDLQKQLSALPFFIKPQSNNQYYQILTNYLFSQTSEGNFFIRGKVFNKLAHFIGRVQVLPIEKAVQLSQSLIEKQLENMSKIIAAINKDQNPEGTISDAKLRPIMQLYGLTTKEIQFMIAQKALESADLAHLKQTTRTQ